MRLSFSHLFGISGRSGRLEYFLHTIIDVVFIGVMIFTIIALQEYLGISVNETALGISILAIILFGAAVEFCAVVRRFHDMNMSGWMMLLSLIPIANIIIGLMLLFKGGDEGDNNYGAPPG